MVLSVEMFSISITCRICANRNVQLELGLSLLFDSLYLRQSCLSRYNKLRTKHVEEIYEVEGQLSITGGLPWSSQGSSLMGHVYVPSRRFAAV